MSWLKYFNIFKWFTNKKSPSTTPPVAGSPDITLPTRTEDMDLKSLDYPWKNLNSCIVIDAYEKNPIDWARMAEDKKVVGVIHRSSIGLVVDTEYKSRKKTATDLGYLWGAYHLGKRGNTLKQADLFLSLIGDDFSTLMALDLEDTNSESMMSIDEALVFINYVYEKTGRVLVVYANDSVTKALNVKLKDNSLLQASKLWYARFKGKVSDFPSGIWKNYFLWQFSSEINCSKNGTCLYNVPGTSFDMDINVFYGTPEELKKSWANELIETQKPATSPSHTQSATPWLEIAKLEVGQKEIAGSKHNPRIVDYHSATTLKATDDEVPWCSSFVSWCLEKSGIPSAKNAWARSYLNYGRKIVDPVEGCIVVLSRGSSSGHVGFYVGETNSDVVILGGNQGNEVCIAKYPRSRVLGYRLPN